MTVKPKRSLSIEETQYIDELVGVLRREYTLYLQTFTQEQGTKVIKLARDKILHEEKLAQEEAEKWLRKQELPWYRRLPI